MVGLIGVGTGFLALGVLPPSAFYIALAFGILAGITQPLTNGGVGAIMQSSIAPEMQGRVMGLLSAGTSAMAPLGLVIAGPMADKLGIQFPFIVAGVVTILMGIAGFLIPAVMNVEEEGQQYLSGAGEAAPAD